MKRFVNGVEVDLTESGASIQRFSDRLLVKTGSGTLSAVAIRVGDQVQVSFGGQIYIVAKAPNQVRGARSKGNGEILAPMPGQIVDILVEQDQPVQMGDKLVVLEAMKTQQAFSAPFDGLVTKVAVNKGDQVSEGALLVRVEAVV